MRTMHTDGEATPLLRGRPAEGGPAFRQQQPADDGTNRVLSQEQSVIFSRRARGHRLLLAVAAAVGTAMMLVMAAGLMKGPEVAERPPRGGTKLSTPGGGSGATRRDPGGQSVGKAGARVKEGDASGAGGDERDAQKEASSGWRSQPERSGLTSNTESGDKGEGAVGTSSTKPNVFFFLIDDMGFGDIGYQSTDLSEMSPNLDRLAAGGVKLTNYYSMAVCTPARASLMTGRYPVRYGMQYSVLMVGSPSSLPLNEKILPQYMNEAGYESHMVGKWHLGSYEQSALPNKRGFETYLGYLHGMDTYYSHKNPETEVDGRFFFDLGYGNASGYHDLSPSNTTLGASCSDGRGGPSWDDASRDSLDPAEVCYTGTYSTDVFVGRARQIVQSKTPFDEEPLFLYLAHQAVHSPIGPAPWGAFTPEEHELLKAVREKTGSAQRERFAGVLMFLDKRIGAFVDMLEQEGWLENSVIVVASDNGGCPSAGGCNYPLRGTKQSVYEGGRKVPAFVWSKSHLPSEAWGTTYDKMMHSTDWLPTIASFAGVELTGSAGALDGVDQWESLKSNGLRGAGDSTTLEQLQDEGPRTEMLYDWDSPLMQEGRNLTQGAYRLGDWKLLVNVWCSGYYSHDLDVIKNDILLDPAVTCGGTGQCEDCEDDCQLYPETYAYGNKLFNIKDDPREEHDLYDQHPEIAEQIRQRAEEVVFAEWTTSNFRPVNTDSYRVFEENGWWLLPWAEILAEEES